MSHTVDLQVGGYPLDNANPIPFVSSAEASIVDTTTTAGVTYFCSAPPGTASSAASWRCAKFVQSTGVTTWADGNANYDNVADDRASLTYS